MPLLPALFEDFPKSRDGCAKSGVFGFKDIVSSEFLERKVFQFYRSFES